MHKSLAMTCLSNLYLLFRYTFLWEYEYTFQDLVKRKRQQTDRPIPKPDRAKILCWKFRRLHSFPRLAEPPWPPAHRKWRNVRRTWLPSHARPRQRKTGNQPAFHQKFKKKPFTCWTTPTTQTWRKIAVAGRSTLLREAGSPTLEIRVYGEQGKPAKSQRQLSTRTCCQCERLGLRSAEPAKHCEVSRPSDASAGRKQLSGFASPKNS